MKRKGLAAETAVIMIILAVVAVVLIYSLRAIPQEVQRQQSCEAHAGFCADEPTCPSGTQRIDYDCAENRPCCIGVVEEHDEEDVSVDIGMAQDIRPVEEEHEERRRVTELQERLTKARRENDLARISAEYDAAKELIINRFAQYRSPANRPMSRETTPFDYNTVKSFEQLTLAAEAAFRIAGEEKRWYATSENYFNWMCRSWLLLTRAHLLGYYDESTYGLHNWLANKERVFREYGDYIGPHNPVCEMIRPITRSTDFTTCKELLSSGTVGSGVGACSEFGPILGPYSIDFEHETFSVEGAGIFYPKSLQEIFGEEES